ncbi:unnamed protein product, partial [Polarella glacialis]
AMSFLSDVLREWFDTLQALEVELGFDLPQRLRDVAAAIPRPRPDAAGSHGAGRGNAKSWKQPTPKSNGWRMALAIMRRARACRHRRSRRCAAPLLSAARSILTPRDTSAVRTSYCCCCCCCCCCCSCCCCCYYCCCCRCLCCRCYLIRCYCCSCCCCCFCCRSRRRFCC